MIVLFNKPYQVLCQFTDSGGRETLADYIDIADIYAAGRLDRDSEGLLVLTDDGKLQHRIAHPRNKMPKRYWAQVEGIPGEDAIRRLRKGVMLKDGLTLPAKVRVMDEPVGLWERQPPVRFRRHIPTGWLEIELKEGRNRQVRRMTAAVGLPTLRLIRSRIAHWDLGGLQPGEWIIVDT